MSGYVYAFSDGERVKIGFSVRPKDRLHQVRCNSGSAFKMLGAVEATREQERELHGLLTPELVSGNEWYRRGGQLVEHFVSQIVGRGPVLPTPKAPGRPRGFSGWKGRRGQPIDDVIDALGGTSAVARLTGRPAQAVSNWRRRGKAPPEAYLIISRALSERGLSVPLHVLGMDEPPMEKPPPDPEAPQTGDRGAMN